MADAKFRAKLESKERVGRLKGKVAVITGGNSGIGRATAFLFAREGAKVVIGAREPISGEETVKLIKEAGGDAIFVKSDVSNEGDVKSLIAQAMVKYKKLDILYNNAGIELAKPVTETSSDEWDRVLNTNLRGVFYGCKYAIPYMVRQGGGSIVNTASVAGLVGNPNLAAYCASKGGVVLLTKEMAIDYAKNNIRVNCVCPGAVATSMIERFISKSPNPEEARKNLALMHPLGRIGKPEEIANAVLFLASDESSFVTGHALAVDGGLTAQ